MTYDERLTERIRDVLAAEADIEERRMFGGLAFSTGGNLAVVSSHTGKLMVRVGADAGPGLVGAGVEAVVMRGRPMAGWLYVDAAKVARRAQLERWVDRGVTFARALPPKRR